MKNLGIHPLAVSLDARKTLPKGCESIVTIQELYMTSPENKKGQLQKNYRTVFQHLPLPLFFFRGNVRKKNIFPQKLVKNGALHRVGSLKNSMSWNCISKLSMAIEGTPPPNGLLKGQWWFNSPWKKAGYFLGFYVALGGGLGPLRLPWNAWDLSKYIQKSQAICLMCNAKETHGVQNLELARIEI